MEHLYTKNDQEKKQLKTSPDKIRFLLNYSKSLHITKTGEMTFEGHLN